MTELASQITMDAAIHHGSPVVAGTRVPVALVLGSLAGGMSKEEVSREYELSAQQIESALAFAADVVAQVEVVSLAGT
jgi:uncharacterized protein (DUF433 family)